MRKKIDKDLIIRTCNESATMAEACGKLGMNFGTFTKYAKRFECYKPNQGAKGTTKPSRPVYDLNEVLEGKHPGYQRKDIKRRMLKENLLVYECLLCGISEWKGKRLSLHLDHINGNPTDHRRDNLRLLCPNCHSQTDTYAGKSSNVYE